jgi:hypothetical protein
MTNFRMIDRETGVLLPPSADEWLPERHLARFVVEVIERLDLRAMSGSYRGSGSASYHPKVLQGLLVCGYATGVFSSRKLERATYDSVALVHRGERSSQGECAAFVRPITIRWRRSGGAFSMRSRAFSNRCSSCRRPVLFRIDPITYDAPLKEIRAQLEFAELRLSQMTELQRCDTDCSFDVEQRDPEVNQLRVQLDGAKRNLDKTAVKAAADGYVMNPALRKGACVTSQSPVMAFNDLGNHHRRGNSAKL